MDDTFYFEYTVQIDENGKQSIEIEEVPGKDPRERESERAKRHKELMEKYDPDSWYRPRKSSNG